MAQNMARQMQTERVHRLDQPNVSSSHSDKWFHRTGHLSATKKSYQYVLLGKFQSDPIESRFGWYRQLAGANYFLSVRQFLEAEKCIRLKSLLKFSNHSLEDLKEVMEDVAEQRKEDIVDSVDAMDMLLGIDSLQQWMTKAFCSTLQDI